jgi:DNA-binding GntR family transcriptional regulator
MQAFSDVDLIDTDPLVTMPMVRNIVPATTLPRIPSLAEQILLATDAMRRRDLAPASGRRGPAPDSRTLDCSVALMAELRRRSPDGMEGAQAWHWIRATHPHRSWTRSVLDRALSRLCTLGLVDNRPGSPGRRLYVARGIE